MTQTPQTSDAAEAEAPGGDGEAQAPAFQPILYDMEPQKPSRKLLVFAGVAVLLGGIGLIFWGGKPDPAAAQPAPLDVANMTARELAEDASPQAARELARRMFHGTPAESAAASSAITCYKSPRLARNLAMAMALEQHKRAQNRAVQVQREHKRLMEDW